MHFPFQKQSATRYNSRAAASAAIAAAAAVARPKPEPAQKAATVVDDSADDDHDSVSSRDSFFQNSGRDSNQESTDADASDLDDDDYDDDDDDDSTMSPEEVEFLAEGYRGLSKDFHREATTLIKDSERMHKGQRIEFKRLGEITLRRFQTFIDEHYDEVQTLVRRITALDHADKQQAVMMICTMEQIPFKPGTELISEIMNRIKFYNLRSQTMQQVQDFITGNTRSLHHEAVSQVPAVLPADAIGACNDLYPACTDLHPDFKPLQAGGQASSGRQASEPLPEKETNDMIKQLLTQMGRPEDDPEKIPVDQLQSMLADLQGREFLNQLAGRADDAPCPDVPYRADEHDHEVQQRLMSPAEKDTLYKGATRPHMIVCVCCVCACVCRSVCVVW